MNDIYDVVVMGGGPGGATLATLLARQGEFKIAVLEKARFPREHIGESFSHRIVPVLAESGALDKVLASDCWVRKYGGYYAWDPQDPAATFFEHAAYEKDGVLRWSIHVDRAEFDKILLDHAASCGVDVFEETQVVSVAREASVHLIRTADGRSFRAKLFVEASGRDRSMVGQGKKTFLSGYKNIAIWQHILGGKAAQSAPGGWNIFREQDLSAIGSFAFQDGWYWYIPVRKLVNGKRTLTHSLGMVTDPSVLSRPGCRFTDSGALLEKAKEVPILKDLVANAQPISDELHTATNYSMISERFCDYDERWILIGDSAHFVDPLFSSGVAFALVYAATANLLIRSTFDGSVADADKRDLWRDFNDDWQSMARSYALAIDQWYHAIAKRHPDSVYWGSRADAPANDQRDQTFHALVDTEISPDLLQVLTHGQQADALDADGPLVTSRRAARSSLYEDQVTVRLAPGVRARRSKTVEVIRRVKQSAQPDAGKALAARTARYWDNPTAGSAESGPLYPAPLPCYRFCRDGDADESSLKFYDEDGGLELEQLLRNGVQYASLREKLSGPQSLLLARMRRLGFVQAV